MVGFLSNASSPVGVIKEFGITVAMGIFSAFIIFVTFVPACKLLLDRWRQGRGKPLLSRSNEIRARRRSGELEGLSARMAAQLDRGADIALTRPKAVVTLVIPLTIIMLLLATQLSTIFSFSDFLPEGLEITDEFNYLQDMFESPDETAVIYIQDEDLARADVFLALSAAQSAMKDDRRVLIREGSPLSPLTVMQDLAKNSTGVHEGDLYDEGFAAFFDANDVNDDDVPETNIQGLLERVLEDHPDELDNTLYRDPETGKFTVLLVRINTNSAQASLVDQIHDDLNDDIQPLEDLEEAGKLNRVVATGEPVIIDVVLRSINQSMINSIIITIAVSAVMLTFVFYFTSRSWALGLLTTLPVVLVLIWVLGTMSLVGIPLNFLTILVAALTIGLGITYAIHITHRFTEELEDHGDIELATHRTVKRTGSALSGAAMTTVVGFGVLVLSVQPPMQQFGKVTAMTILYSFIASVYVLPSLLVMWARKYYQPVPVDTPVDTPDDTPVDTTDEAPIDTPSGEDDESGGDDDAESTSDIEEMDEEKDTGAEPDPDAKQDPVEGTENEAMGSGDGEADEADDGEPEADNGEPDAGSDAGSDADTVHDTNADTNAVANAAAEAHAHAHAETRSEADADKGTDADGAEAHADPALEGLSDADAGAVTGEDPETLKAPTDEKLGAPRKTEEAKEAEENTSPIAAKEVKEAEEA